jgi:hypothetical protein
LWLPVEVAAADPVIVSAGQVVAQVDIELHQVFQYHPVHLLQSPLVQVVLPGPDNQVVYLPMVAKEMTQFLVL